eukprot:1150964-Pelagomonas_calceolata.AAC.12
MLQCTNAAHHCHWPTPVTAAARMFCSNDLAYNPPPHYSPTAAAHHFTRAPVLLTLACSPKASRHRCTNVINQTLV